MGSTKRRAVPPRKTGAGKAATLGRSRPFAGSGYVGPIPEAVWEVLARAWDQPIAASANYAREQSTSLAFAASMGWLSTIDPTGRTYSRLWHATAEGLIALRTRDD